MRVRIPLLIVAAGCTAAPPSPPPQAVPDARAEAVAAFATVQRVLQHAGCQNCHVPGDAPLQFDAGLPHQMKVVRGPDGHGAPGLPCSNCQDVVNPPASYGPNVLPGAPTWHLPPPDQKMVFINLSPAELCADPAGINDIMPVYITPDGQAYAYAYRRFLSDLYVVSGLS